METIGIFNRLTRWVQSKIYVQPDMGSFSYSNDSLATNETIFSAITMLANSIASAPISVRENYEKLSPEENRIAYLCEYGFNPQMSTFTFIRTLETLRNSTGAGYALKEYDRLGEIAALWVLKSENVDSVIERDSKELYYRIRDIEGMVYIHHSHILAVTHISEDGIHPLNPLDVLRGTLDYDKKVKEFSVNQMENGLKANILIKVNGSMQPQEMNDYSEIVRRFQKNGILYMDKGKELQELKNSSIIDPKVFEVENITVARVARVYTIPLEKFLPENSSYSSAEQSDLRYLKDSILPAIRMYEQEFTRQLLTEGQRLHGIRVKFSLNGFARADMETRGEFYFKGIRSAWFCPNEVRELEDLPPVSGGEAFYISKDLIPVTLSGKEDES